MDDVPSMDLELFVSATLVQIVTGVANAQQQIGDLGGNTKINPIVDMASYTTPTPVQFDVAVTVSGSTEASGKAGRKIASIVDVGGGGGATHSTEAVSRIRFSVAVSMPSVPTED